MSGQRDSTLSPLVRLRSNRVPRLAFTVLGTVVGLALVWVHWLGLVMGAALVAFPRRSLIRGILAGVGFGILVTVIHVGSLAVVGQAAFATSLKMGEILMLSLAIPLIAGSVGGLFRGLV